MELYTKRQNHHYRQSDIITVDDRNTSAVKRFLFALLILVLLFFSVNSQALAQYAPEVRTVGVFELRFYSGSINTPNYVPNDSTSSSSNMPWSTDQIDTVVKGMKYWNELINTSRVADTNYKIVINVIRTPLSPGVSANGRGFITDIINNYGKPSETQTDGRIAYNSDGTNPESNINLATTIHELGHVIGFNTNYYSYVDENKNKYFYTNLVDAYGEKWDPTKKDNAGYYNVITANITNGANNGTFDIMGFYDSTTYRTPMFLGKPNGAIEELIGSVHNPDGSLDLSKLDILSQASIMGIDDGGYDVANSLTHSGGLHSVMSYSTFRNMKFLPEIELAMLEELGYSVNRRKAFGHSYYKRSDNLYDGQVIGVGYDSDFIFGIGAHVYMDGLTLLQSADISSRGEEGAGIRVDGSNNTINIDKYANIEASGENAVGLFVAWGSKNILINRGNISATGEGGIGVKLSVEGGDAKSHYTNTGSGDARDLAEHARAITDLNDELVERFDISGKITGNEYAIFISNTAHVDTINILNGAEIYGKIQSQYTDSSRVTQLTFGKLADNNGAVPTTTVADPNFKFVLNNELIGRDQFDITTFGGTTTIGENAYVSAKSITVKANSQFNVASNYKYDNNSNKINVGSFTLEANAILGINTVYNEGGDVPYINASSVNIDSTDSKLDITSFKKGSYTIFSNGVTLNFNKFLVAGQTPSSRHNITINNNKLQLDATNVSLKWKGGNGTWDNGSKKWDNAGTDDIFIDGDSVTFNNSFGEIYVPVSVETPTAIFSSGAKYRFTGADIIVTNNLDLTHAGTETRFNQNVQAGSLQVDRALLGIAANKSVNVSGNAEFNQATLEIGTGDSNTSAGKISVAGTAKVSGGIVNVYGSQRRGVQYLFLEAQNLEVDSVEGGFTLGATASGNRGIVSYDAGIGKYWITIDGLLVDHSRNAFTSNQRSFGNYLNELSPRVNEFNDMNDVLMVFENLSENSPVRYRFAMDETMGNIYATAGSAGIQNTLIANRTIATYLRRPPLSEIIPCHICQGVCHHLVGKPTSWISAVGMGATTQSDSNGHGYSQSSGGSVFGVDIMRRIGCHFGLYGSAMENVLTSKGIKEHSRSHEFMGGFYFRADNRIGYLLFNNGYGFNQYKTDRTMTEFENRQARSSHNSFNTTIYSELGTYYLDPIFRWHGYIGLQYAGVYQEAVRESGAGSLNIIGDPTSTTSLRGFLGFRTERFERTLLGGMISGDFNFAWMHECVGQTQTEFIGRFEGSLDSSLKYKVRGTDTGRDWAIFGASLGYDYGRIRFFGGYDAYLSGNQSLHSGTLGVVYVW